MSLVAGYPTYLVMASIDSSKAALSNLILDRERANYFVSRPRAPRRRGRGQLGRHGYGICLADRPLLTLYCPNLGLPGKMRA